MKGKFYSLIGLAILILGLISILAMVDVHDQAEYLNYSHAEIEYDRTIKLRTRDYAVKQGDGQFLFAADTPDELKLGLVFSLPKLLTVEVNPLYPDWICGASGIGKATIKFEGQSTNKTFSLMPNQKFDFDLSVSKGDVIQVSLENPDQKNCGRAEVKLVEANYAQLYPMLFLLVWMLVLFGLYRFKLSIVFGIVGIAVNLAIVYANSTTSISSITNLANASYLSISLIGTLVLVHLLPVKKVIRVFLCLALMICVCWFLLIFGGHFLLFAMPVSDDTVHAILQSNVSETIEFLESFVGLRRVLYIILGVVALAFISLKMNHRTKGNNLLTTIFAFALLLPLLLTFDTQLERTPILEKFVSARSQYFEELSTFKSLQESRSKTIEISDLSLVQSGQKLIVIIGESANKNHMSLYGYPRDTTPHADLLLDKADIIRFDRVYSSHTHTNPSLSSALTWADQYTDRKWMTSPSLLQLANKLNIKTSWLTNQQLLSSWDNHVSVIGQDAGRVINRNKRVGVAKNATRYDEILVDDLKSVLRDDNQTQLIFLHLQGSHASYCKRFPAETAQFENQRVSKGEYGALASFVHRTNSAAINCYDDSIYYTDKVLGQVIDFLGEQNSPTSLLYFSDHSEDVINNKAHNSAVFSYEMAEIPMLFWASDSWRDKYANVWNNLDNNRKKLFTNDHVFETVSGLLGLKSSEIDVRNDLSSNLFAEHQEPTTLMGKKALIEEDNWRYWQQLNSQKIVDRGECSKLIPHRANSIGKARSAIQNGLCGLEIDVRLISQSGRATFGVGHDKESMTGLSLDEFLAGISFEKIEKIWLDIKGVKQSQLSNILERLNFLDKKFKIKQKTIVEMSYFGKDAATIRNAGYQLSYYLPTSTIKNITIGSEAAGDAAKEMARRIERMRPSVISFDLRLYPFVKAHLEPLIETEIHHYHTWFPEGMGMSSPKLIQQLSEKDYYSDTRINTILLPYYSPFNI